ncbi:probable E3 ubiquitin-protein ligase ARI8 [Olea europaea var. sylvestris]|uniref:probable E3 ubiquitin-protein ligase ARI8 n=1 Tax=Olea europaea var. sylvestris TaxID=158386 RepID=UPI000C1D0589|nr:probable E3 ubiquitin-protein ligase ARI8 [Olea europaea var. sylvestris]
MESEDEMELMMDDSNDDDEFYGGGGDDDDLDDVIMDYDGFIDHDTDDSDDFDFSSSSHSHHNHHHRSQNYAILSEADIQQLQEENITKVSTVLSIPRDAASILPSSFKCERLPGFS